MTNLPGTTHNSSCRGQSLQHLQATDRIFCVRVIVAQYLPASLHSLFEVRDRLFQLVLRIQQVRHVVDRDQCVRVAVAQYLPARLQRLLARRALRLRRSAVLKRMPY